VSGGAKGGSEASRAPAFTAPGAPRVLSASASGVSSEFAQLRAQIRPLGASTSYWFEYGPTTAYGHDAPALSEAAPAGESIGSGGPTGGSSEQVTQRISGLAAGSEYHFRVVARNELEEDGRVIYGPGVTYGPDETFTTQAAVVPGLPDGRAYELVTPNTKEGGTDLFGEPEHDEDEFEHTDEPATPASSGEALLLEAESAFGAFPGASHSAYAFQREAGKGEWALTSLAEPGLGVQSVGQALFDQDLSRVAFNDGVGAQNSEAGERLENLVGPPGGPYLTLHADPAVHNANEGVEKTEIAGASSDLSHVVLQSTTTATGQAGQACPGAEAVAVICEWAGGYETGQDGETVGQLRLVNVANNGQPVSRCGAALGGSANLGGAGAELSDGDTRGAVSGDGARVFFTAPDAAVGAGCWQPQKEEETGVPANAPQLYARVDNGQAQSPLGAGGQCTVAGDACTVEVSAPEAGVSEGGHAPVEYPAYFAGASEDGSEVFFVTRTWVTQNHPQGHDDELYGCGLVEEGSGPRCQLTRVSAGEEGEPSQTEGAHLYMVPAVAAQGGAVYFTAFGALAKGATPQTEVPYEGLGSFGPVNLYRYQPAGEGVPAGISYVATVGAEDHGGSCRRFAPCSRGDWYTTPDGAYLLFGDSQPVDGYNEGAGCDAETPEGQGANEEGRCMELYRYDAGAAVRGERPLVCVSCDPDGVHPSQNAQFGRSASAAAFAGAVRAISDDGEYVFFDTLEQLVAQASNQEGPHPTLDTYEWHDGVISLIGSGVEAGPTFFLGYSPFVNPRGETVEGGNVFIGTHARLSPQDTGSVGNVYDARVCEPEDPCIGAPAAETAQCEGGSCQLAPAAPGEPTATLLAPPGRDTTSSGSGSAKPLTRAQRLAKALAACRKDGSKRKRVSCERRARKSYGAAKAKKAKAKKSAKTGHRGKK